MTETLYVRIDIQFEIKLKQSEGPVKMRHETSFLE